MIENPENEFPDFPKGSPEDALLNMPEPVYPDGAGPAELRHALEITRFTLFYVAWCLSYDAKPDSLEHALAKLALTTLDKLQAMAQLAVFADMELPDVTS